MSRPRILFKALVGSRAYNLHNENSDWDYRYVQVSPIKDVLSPFKNQDTKVKVYGNKDDAVWELSSFLKYAANGNPSVYEALFSPSVELGSGTQPFWKEIIMNRHKFFDARRVYDAHRGYAASQLKKVDWQEWSPRARKAIVAYLRVLNQGTQILSTGQCVLNLEPSFCRTRLLHIKNMEHPPTVEVRKRIEWWMQLRERKIEEAFVSTTLTTPDYDWIEDFNLRCYQAFG